MKNSGQKKTVKQNNKRMAEEKTDKKEFGISLRIQLIVGFAVPILFLIGVGVISYRNASSGMIENYENSAINALDMTMECLERGFSPSVANVLELANNTMVSSYVQAAMIQIVPTRAQCVRQSLQISWSSRRPTILLRIFILFPPAIFWQSRQPTPPTAMCRDL